MNEHKLEILLKWGFRQLGNLRDVGGGPILHIPGRSRMWNVDAAWDFYRKNNNLADMGLLLKEVEK